MHGIKHTVGLEHLTKHENQFPMAGPEDGISYVRIYRILTGFFWGLGVHT